MCKLNWCDKCSLLISISIIIYKLYKSNFSAYVTVIIPIDPEKYNIMAMLLLSAQCVRTD